MERMIGSVMLAVVVTLMLCSCASSRLTHVFNNSEEQYRRNLLANGLGVTPPMGYEYNNIYHLYAVSPHLLL